MFRAPLEAIRPLQTFKVDRGVFVDSIDAVMPKYMSVTAGRPLKRFLSYEYQLHLRLRTSLNRQGLLKSMILKVLHTACRFNKIDL